MNYFQLCLSEHGSWDDGRQAEGAGPVCHVKLRESMSSDSMFIVLLGLDIILLWNKIE